MLIFRDADPFLILLLALAVDLAFGDMPWIFRYLPHPVAIAGSAVARLDRRLNRARRSDRTRLLRGVLATFVLVVVAAALGWVVKEYLGFVHYSAVVEGVIVAILLAQRSLFEHVAAVAKALQAGGIAAGRTAVAKIVGRDPESLDEHGVIRAAIESLYENFSDGVVAPSFWYLLFGLPGIFAYKTANTLDSMIGHRSPKYFHFGWAAARLDDALNWIPARLTGALLCIAAAGLPETSARAAWATMLRDARKHRSPNAGWPEAAGAGALGLALGGPRSYGGTTAYEPWLGEGRARATLPDLAAALKLFLAAAACFAVLLLLGAALAHSL